MMNVSQNKLLCIVIFLTMILQQIWYMEYMSIFFFFFGKYQSYKVSLTMAKFPILGRCIFYISFLSFICSYGIRHILHELLEVIIPSLVAPYIKAIYEIPNSQADIYIYIYIKYVRYGWQSHIRYINESYITGMGESIWYVTAILNVFYSSNVTLIEKTAPTRISKITSKTFSALHIIFYLTWLKYTKQLCTY